MGVEGLRLPRISRRQQAVIPQGSGGEMPVLVREIHQGLREPRDRRRGAQSLQGAGFRGPVEEAEEPEDCQLRTLSQPAGVSVDNPEGVASLFLVGAVKVDLAPLADVAAVGSA